jgi:hypothetical protein
MKCAVRLSGFEKLLRRVDRGRAYRSLPGQVARLLLFPFLFPFLFYGYSENCSLKLPRIR